MSRVESDEDNTAELAAIALDSLDRGEFIRRREEKFKSLHETFQNGGRTWYRCLVCNNPSVKWCLEQEGRHTRYLVDMEAHMVDEHRDKYLDEVASVMRKEVLARKRANHGVEDPVRWESYYRTNCKLRRPV